MFKFFPPAALSMGLLAAFTGYAASFTIVLAGLNAMGASAAQAATGLFFATLGMGVCSIWLPLLTRVPSAVAWSTPGAAFLASSAAPEGGFAAATGAFLIAAVMIVATGLVPALGRIIAGIPKPMAAALLAGVLVNLCIAPAIALGEMPLAAAIILGAWAVGHALHRMAAIPFALLALVAVVAVLPTGAVTVTAGMDRAHWLPALAPIWPQFALQDVLSLAVPLYLVTMAGQNIPGFAVLNLNGYAVDQGQMLRNTGFASVLIAPFGSIPVNMSAITAAMMAGDDAGSDASKRYIAGVVSGMAYIGLALAAGAITTLTTLAPMVLLTAVAGLALLPALGAALRGATEAPQQMEAPVLTFVLTAGGVTILGLSGAFWGVLAGTALWQLKARRQQA